MTLHAFCMRSVVQNLELLVHQEHMINLYSLNKSVKEIRECLKENEGKWLKHSRIANKRSYSSLSSTYRPRFMPVEGLVSQISSDPPPFHADR